MWRRGNAAVCLAESTPVDHDSQPVHHRTAGPPQERDERQGERQTRPPPVRSMPAHGTCSSIRFRAERVLNAVPFHPRIPAGPRLPPPGAAYFSGQVSETRSVGLDHDTDQRAASLDQRSVKRGAGGRRGGCGLGGLGREPARAFTTGRFVGAATAGAGLTADGGAWAPCPGPPAAADPVVLTAGACASDLASGCASASGFAACGPCASGLAGGGACVSGLAGAWGSLFAADGLAAA